MTLKGHSRSSDTALFVRLSKFERYHFQWRWVTLCTPNYPIYKFWVAFPIFGKDEAREISNWYKSTVTHSLWKSHHSKRRRGRSLGLSKLWTPFYLSNAFKSGTCIDHSECQPKHDKLSQNWCGQFHTTHVISHKQVVITWKRYKIKTELQWKTYRRPHVVHQMTLSLEWPWRSCQLFWNPLKSHSSENITNNCDDCLQMTTKSYSLNPIERLFKVTGSHVQ